MCFNTRAVELLAADSGIPDFSEYFGRHALACIPLKPDLFIIYMLARGLGVHVEVAHEGGVWSTSSDMCSWPDFCLVYTRAPMGFEARLPASQDIEPLPCVPSIGTSVRKDAVQEQKEHDWTSIMPPRDRPS